MTPVVLASARTVAVAVAEAATEAALPLVHR